MRRKRCRAGQRAKRWRPLFATRGGWRRIRGNSPQGGWKPRACLLHCIEPELSQLRSDVGDSEIAQNCGFGNKSSLVAQRLPIAGENSPSIQQTDECRGRGGNIFHGEMSLDQMFAMRPVAGWARYRTPISGLYLCGSGAHPGGGVRTSRDYRVDFRNACPCCRYHLNDTRRRGPAHIEPIIGVQCALGTSDGTGKQRHDH